MRWAKAQSLILLKGEVAQASEGERKGEIAASSLSEVVCLLYRESAGMNGLLLACEWDAWHESKVNERMELIFQEPDGRKAVKFDLKAIEGVSLEPMGG